jgi:hypothetical protein
VTRKSLTRGHVAFDHAFDTSGFFRKIAVRLDSPYLQQIAFIRKMPKMPSHAALDARASGGSKEPTTTSSSSS